jgi:transposase-like protein
VSNLYSGTVFAHKRFRPAQVVLFLQGLSKGTTTSQWARELNIGRQTVHYIRQVLQASAQMLQPEDVLPDTATATDEMFQNAGEKGEPHLDPKDPPRRRGNKRRGHGTYENDRPPVIGTVGRESGHVRLRVAHHTDGATLSAHVHQWTLPTATVYTDGWRGYNGIDRPHAIVCHSDGEWARDDDMDGFCETHINSIEGVWTTVRNFLRPFRGVHKKFLAGYIAICEFAMNIKSVTVEFISKLVQRT